MLVSKVFHNTMQNRSWLLQRLLLICSSFKKHILSLWRRNTNIETYYRHMPPIWEPLPNSPQCLKLYIYARYPWNKTRHSYPKQIPQENRCIHQEWDRSIQIKATHYWRLPSCWTQYERSWGCLRIALEPTHHIKLQPPLLYHIFILSLIFLF